MFHDRSRTISTMQNSLSPAGELCTWPASVPSKKFYCTYPGCGKEFNRSGTLKRHYRMHTGYHLERLVSHQHVMEASQIYKYRIIDCDHYLPSHIKFNVELNSHFAILDQYRLPCIFLFLDLSIFACPPWSICYVFVPHFFFCTFS